MEDPVISTISFLPRPQKSGVHSRQPRTAAGMITPSLLYEFMYGAVNARTERALVNAPDCFAARGRFAPD